MNPIRKLAAQTATYGFSTIVGRLLNYALVPLHLRVFAPEAYGVVADIYAYVAFVGVVLTYGMETAYFRFRANEKYTPNSVYSTAYISHLVTTAGFVLAFVVFSTQLAHLLKYPNHTEYVVWFAFIVGLDALAALPLARLRAQNRVKRFVAIRLSNIVINVLLNLVFLVALPYAYNQGWWVGKLYNPSIGVGYVFIANLVASAITLVLLLPQVLKIKAGFNTGLWRTMLGYALPILVMGLAGMVNEVFDRIMLKYLLVGSDAEKQYLVGIYGACYKISIFMTLFVQMYRFAAEPFFFNQQKDKNNLTVYADVMTYFVAIGGAIFLGVMAYIDFIKYIIIGNPVYYPGLVIVPWLLLANLFLGMYFNYSFWFKLGNKTMYGAYISIGGAIITLLLNGLLIPVMGYLGSAIATFVCYGSMMLVCYYLGRGSFPVPYNNTKILLYISIAVGLYLVSTLFSGWFGSSVLLYGLNTGLLLVYGGAFFILDGRKLLRR